MWKKKWDWQGKPDAQLRNFELRRSAQSKDFDRVGPQREGATISNVTMTLAEGCPTRSPSLPRRYPSPPVDGHLCQATLTERGAGFSDDHLRSHGAAPPRVLERGLDPTYVNQYLSRGPTAARTIPAASAIGPV